MQNEIKNKIKDLIKDYFQESSNFKLNPSKDRVTVGYPCYDNKEIERAVEVLV